MYRITYFPIESGYEMDERGLIGKTEEFESVSDAVKRFEEIDKTMATAYLTLTNNT